MFAACDCICGQEINCPAYQAHKLGDQTAPAAACGIVCTNDRFSMINIERHHSKVNAFARRM